MNGKKILIFGGTGSLGTKLVEVYGSTSSVTVFSRDENKHWKMSLTHKNVNFIIGDIRNKERVKYAIDLVEPEVIIIAAALKHMDRCEYEVSETIATNYEGTQNVVNSLNVFVETVLFISTDKACSPINTYGLSKSLSEKVMVEHSKKNNRVRFLTVRYGNVLDSRGSIIPILNETKDTFYKLTDAKMTRFIMTQKEAVDLIDFTINHCKSGDICIPRIPSMYIKDLLELFAEKNNIEEIRIVGLRPGEKIDETLVNYDERTHSIELENYFVIKPCYKTPINPGAYIPYTSLDLVLSKDGLKEYLKNLSIV